MRYFNIKAIKLIVTCFFCLLSTQSYAESKIYTPFLSSVALSHYDAVAYFTEHKAVKGNSDYSLEYQDATWHFSSQNNLDLFRADPSQYAPQYGGYCAWAISRNHLAKSDPLAWKIIDNKLYLNYDLDVQKMWLKDTKNLIIKGDQHWPSILEE